MIASARHPKIVIGPRWLAAMREMFAPPPETRVVDLMAKSADFHREMSARLDEQVERLDDMLARLETYR